MRTTGNRSDRWASPLRRGLRRAAAVSLALPLLAPLAGAQPIFQNITGTAGLSNVGDHEVAWGDFNNDGWVDLYSEGKFWRNDAGVFSLVPPVGSTGLGIWGDYDNDGYLDLFVYPEHRLFKNVDGQSFSEVTHILPPMPNSATLGAAWGDFNGDGFVDLYVGGYETSVYQSDALLMNQDGQSFFVAWSQLTNRRPARGVTAADFDEDGDLDIYVSNYRVEANFLWLNDGEGAIVDVAETYGVAGDYDGWSWSYGHTIGSCWGDLDNDGHIDLFVGNFSHPDWWQDRPKLLRNMGPGGNWHFEDRSEGSGIWWQESYASPALGDCNNDGCLDLYMTTVYQGDHSILMRNNGDWTFSDKTDDWLPFPIGVTYQAAWADYDNDGDMDLITGGRLLRNDLGSSRWLKVKLIGGGAVNKAAIGARARIVLGSQTLVRQVDSSTGESNGNDLTLHFGLGNEDGPVFVEVFWPDGTTRGVWASVNTSIVVYSNDTVAAPSPPDAPLTPTLSAGHPNPFTPRSTLRFHLPEAEFVRLSVHDAAGREVRRLLEESLDAGPHELAWDGTGDRGARVPSGVFWVRLATGRGFVTSTKLVVLN